MLEKITDRNFNGPAEPEPVDCRECSGEMFLKYWNNHFECRLNRDEFFKTMKWAHEKGIPQAGTVDKDNNYYTIRKQTFKEIEDERKKRNGNKD